MTSKSTEPFCIHGHPFDEGNTRYRPNRSGHISRECRQCNRDAVARYKARQGPGYNATGAHYQKVARKRRRERGVWGMAVAHNTVADAVRSGKLVKEPCHCGSSEVQGHHFLGYAPEHRLDVVWLCREHHAEAHRKPQANV